MPNPITGDFDAILQVSGKTLNRLLGSMHQNAGTSKNLPTFPHGAFVRLGTPNVVGGVRGTARIQLAAPRIELAHGAQDRFTVTVWIRAHFLPDGGSAPFPEFIHGLVRAEYRLREEFHPRYGVLLAAHVLPDGVSFTAAGPDHSWDAAVTAQVVEALRTRFAMTPHPLKQEFQDRKLRALVAPDGTQAVTTPIALGAAAPAGSAASVDGIALAGRDLAVAVSRDFIMSFVQPQLDALLASKTLVGVTAKSFLGSTSATYRVEFDRATATWGTGTVPVLGVPGGRISFDIAGRAWTPAVLFPNASFTVRHALWLLFDPGTETLTLFSPGAPDVDVDVNGPFGGLVEGKATSTVTSELTSRLTNAVNAANAMLATTATRTKALVDQLRTIDDQADAHFDGAEFTADGAIMRGVVSVAPRAWPRAKLARLADLGGFTAFQSWIPGGRIDELRWRWSWFPPVPGTPPPAGSPAWSAQSHDERFLLRASVSLPGLPPIPGSPEATGPEQAGVVCLAIRGHTIHPITGDDVPVDSEGLPLRVPPCVYFYPPPPPPWSSQIAVEAKKRRLFWKVWGRAATAATAAGASGSASASELAVIDAGAASAGGGSANTLVHYLDEPPTAESLAALAEGTAAAALPERGLLVVLLLREGMLRAAPEIGERLAEASRAFAVPLVVNEDVRGDWSERFELPRGRGGATMLIAPDGRVALRGEGPVDGDALAGALRDALVPAPWPAPVPILAGIEPGSAAPDFRIEPERAEGLNLRRLQGREAVVCFVQPWSDSSRAHAARLQRQQERRDGGEWIGILVVDGLDAGAAAEWGRAHAPSLWTVADPYGEVAAAYGVRMWPTTVLVDRGGAVAGVGGGTDPGAAAMQARAAEGVRAAEG